MNCISQYQKVVKELDRAFSLYIRRRDSTMHGCVCFTCGHTGPIEEMHAGHFISRKWLSLRFDEKNVHAQCYTCNMIKKGNMKKYTERLCEMYGDEIIKYLFDRKAVVATDLTVLEMKNMIRKYKALDGSARPF